MSLRLFSIALVAVMLWVPMPALAHAERDVEFPDGSGAVPEYRTTGPALVVCKPDSLERILGLAEPHRSSNLALLDACAFEHIQAAIDAVTDQGSRILVLPGVYREEPSLAPPSPTCADLEEVSIITYQQQAECPHLQNLIAVMGDDPHDVGRECETERLCHLQIEGTGAVPEDVIIDNAWQKLNALRADRADGFYITNMAMQRSEFNALYILETDGFVADNVLARWNWEYGILTFAVDHGLYRDCEAYGNGDAGLYPGSASDLQGVRHSVEITGCESHHNAIGYSGTAGNSVYVHDNDFHHNSAGITMDSLFPGHPGLPQDSGRFIANRIYSNNENYYDNFLGEDAPCLRDDVSEMQIEEGVVCPTAPVPVGTGLLIAGGNNNLIAENRFWDNHRYSFMLFTVPAVLREEYDPLKQLDTSHFNRFIDNVIGYEPDGDVAPDASGTWWDEGGAGNCWAGNEMAGAWSSDPPGVLLPDCAAMPVQRPPNVARLATIAPCALYDNPENPHPVGCDWMNDPEQPDEATASPVSLLLIDAVVAAPWRAPAASSISSADLGASWFAALQQIMAHPEPPTHVANGAHGPILVR